MERATKQIELAYGTYITQESIGGSLPSGHIFKSNFGMGGTTCEIEDRSRNSIIVMPFRKAVQMKGAKHTSCVQFLGGESLQRDKKIRQIKEQIRDQVVTKVLCVAELLPWLVMEHSDVFSPDNFHLLLDESHLYYTEQDYRTNIWQVIQVYESFPKHRRSMLSATPLSLESLSQNLQDDDHTEIRWEGGEKRTVRVVRAVYPESALVAKLQIDMEEEGKLRALNKRQFEHWQEIGEEPAKPAPAVTYVIALNRVESILRIAKWLLDDKGVRLNVFCSESSEKRYLDVDERINFNPEAPTPGINFFTSAYFHAVDFHPKNVKVFILTHGYDSFQRLSLSQMLQFIGRFRERGEVKAVTFITNRMLPGENVKNQFKWMNNITFEEVKKVVEIGEKVNNLIDGKPILTKDLNILADGFKNVLGFNPFIVQGAVGKFQTGNYRLISSAFIEYEKKTYEMYRNYQSFRAELKTRFEIEESEDNNNLPLDGDESQMPDWVHLWDFACGDQTALEKLPATRRAPAIDMICAFLSKDSITTFIDGEQRNRLKELLAHQFSDLKNSAKRIEKVTRQIALYHKGHKAMIWQILNIAFPKGSVWSSEEVLAKFSELYQEEDTASILTKFIGNKPINLVGAGSLLGLCFKVEKKGKFKKTEIIGRLPYYILSDKKSSFRITPVYEFTFESEVNRMQDKRKALDQKDIPAMPITRRT